MERELWSELSAAISQVDQHFFDDPSFIHSTALIVRVYLWSLLHDRCTQWGTQAKNWWRETRPRSLPSQPTMSRRLRSEEFEQFMQKMEKRLAHLPGASILFKRMDGKPLTIPAHSRDPEAGWGRAVKHNAKGYKLHTIWSGLAMPLQWRVAPLHISEQEMGRRMLRDLRYPGYVTADKNYDANKLFDMAAESENQLVCRRRYGEGKGLGHCYQSPHRLRSKDMLELPTRRLSRFGGALLKQRGQIERDFGNCVSFGGGLTTLPPWVRRHGRVRRCVWGKLMINAARIRIKNRKSRCGE